MLQTQNILFFLSALLSALIMGLMYGYACSVNPGLNKLSDAEYLRAMQSINKEIQNPVFFISFIGTLIILPITTWFSKSHAASVCFYLMIAATLSYIIGVVGTTALGNIPLNNSLEKFDILNADKNSLANERALFEPGWNRFHIIRTLFSIFTTAFIIVAIIKNGAAILNNK